MSFCTKCGQKLEDGDQKCTSCGKVVEQVTKENELIEDKSLLFENRQSTSFIDKLKKTKLKLFMTISVVILCLVFGGIGIAKYTNASKVKEGLTLGNKYLQEGKYDEAILSFKKVIQADPKNIEARVGLAKVYTKIEKPDEAEKILKEAISVEHKNVEPYLELARLYVSKNNLVNAIKILTDGFKATNGERIKLMLEELKSKITVDNINKTIALGENFSLPKEVDVKINNGEVKFPVKWDKTTVDTTKSGAHTFTGTLENADKIVKLTLNVITIASVEDINNTIKQNDKYSLPSKVIAKMTDGSTGNVEVIWNPSSVDVGKPGTYSYQGSINGYGSKVKLILNIESLSNDEEQNYKEDKSKSALDDKKTNILNLQKSLIGKWTDDSGSFIEVVTESTINGNPYQVILDESDPESNKIAIQWGNNPDWKIKSQFIDNNTRMSWGWNPIRKWYTGGVQLKRVN